MANHASYAGAVIPLIFGERRRIFDEMLSRCNSKTSLIELREQNPELLRLALGTQVERDDRNDTVAMPLINADRAVAERCVRDNPGHGGRPTLMLDTAYQLGRINEPQPTQANTLGQHRPELPKAERGSAILIDQSQ